MTNRGLNVTTELQQLATAESHRRRLIPQIEGLKREQNTSGDQVARAKRQGEEVAHLFEASKQRGQKIKQLEFELDSAERQRTVLLEALPNLPHSSVPVGKGAADNVVVRTGVSCQPLTSNQRRIGISDQSSASSTSNGRRKCPGARFAFLMGAGPARARADQFHVVASHQRACLHRMEPAVSGVIDNVEGNRAVA
jgi:seryl-tRNA synthetase